MKKSKELHFEDLVPSPWKPEELRAAREKFGLSRKELANIFRVSIKSIANAETGRINSPLLMFAYGSLMERIAARALCVPTPCFEGSDVYMSEENLKEAITQRT